MEEADIQLPETTVKAKAPKIRTIKGKGLPTVVTIMAYEEEVDKSDLMAEAGDFITLKKDTQLTEFSIDINKNTFDKCVLRIVVYQTNKKHDSLKPLLEEPIYLDVSKSLKKQTITKKLSVFVPKGIAYIGVQFVAFEGDKKAFIEFNAKATGGWIRHANEFEKIPFGLGFPFSVKGYEQLTIDN